MQTSIVYIRTNFLNFFMVINYTNTAAAGELNINYNI